MTRNEDRPRLRDLFSILREISPRPAVYVDLLVASIVVSGGGVVTALFLRLLVDRIIPTGLTAGLNAVAALLLIVLVASSLLDMQKQKAAARLGAKLERRLVRKYLGSVFAADWCSVARYKPADLAGRLSESTAISHGVSSGVVRFVLDLFTILFLSAYVGIQSPTLLFLILAVGVASAAISKSSSAWLRRRQQNRMKAAVAANGAFLETLDGMDSIRAMSMSGSMELGVQSEYDGSLDLGLRASMAEIYHRTMQQALSAGATVGLIWVAASYVIHGNLSLGQMVALNTLSMQLVRAIRTAALITPRVQAAVVAASRTREILSLEIGRLDSVRNEPVQSNRSDRAVTATDLTYGFHEVSVLHDVSFRVELGESLLLTGPSGCGKSTLLKIVAGVLLADSGFLTVLGKSGRDIEELEIGYLPQDPWVFAGSVRENIVAGRDAITDDDLFRACRIAGLLPDNSGLADGLDTPVGDRGGLLSGGQRRRVALARAIVRTPTLLVLDEPFAGLDSTIASGICESITSMEWAPESVGAVLCATHRTDLVGAGFDYELSISGGTAAQVDFRRRGGIAS